MMAGTGSAFSVCCVAAVWPSGCTGSTAGVALGVEGGGVEVCCCGTEAAFVGAMSCAQNGNTKTLHARLHPKKSLPSYLCFDELSRLRIAHPLLIGVGLPR